MDRIWAIIIGVFLVITLWLGSLSASNSLASGVLHVLSLALLVVGIFRLRAGFETPQAVVAVVILLFGIFIGVMQIVPFPFDVWKGFAAYATVEKALALAGVTPSAMTLSLDPASTQRNLMRMLPAVSVFVAALSLDRRQIKYIVWLLLILGVGNTLLGLAQKFQGVQGDLYLNAGATKGTASGTFYNRNHLAAFLYIMLPFIAAIAVGFLRERRMNGLLISVFAFTFAAIFVIGLGATASRAGISLAMVAVVMSGFIAMSNSGVSSASSRSKWLIAVVAFGFFFIAQFGLVGIMRLAETDPVSDYRNVINAVSWQAARDMLPFGSGFGTFVPVYKMFERPDTMLNNFVNQAHNDWLELIIEGGYPAILLLTGFSLWFIWANFSLWRKAGASSEDLLLRAAGIATLLFLIHALVEYGLRAQMLMTLFGLFCGLIALGPSLMQSGRRQFRSETSRELAKQPLQMPSLTPTEPRKGPYFVRQESKTPDMPQ